MTHAATTTFAARQNAPDDVASALTNAGFVLEPSRRVVRSLVDTFDGRLHADGLRLEGREGRAIELRLSGHDTATAVLEVRALPRVVDDLPPGPFRSRVGDAAEDRALLPVVRVRAVCTPAVRRDGDGKIVALATIWSQLAIIGADLSDMVACTVEVDALRGFEKHAQRVSTALARFGLEQLAHDTLTEAAEVSGAHIGGYPGPSDVELDPKMPAIDGYRVVLAALADTIAVNWQGTIDEIDIEFLHDLRIAVRRSRTVLGEAKKVLAPAPLEKARVEFKSLGTATGPPRDLDVYLVEWATYTDALDPATLAELEPVRALLHQRARAAHAELAAELQDPATRTFIDEWRRWLANPAFDDRPAPKSDERLLDVVAKHIERAHTRLVEDGRLIQPDTPAEDVHDLRKDAKRLRYMIECFASVLADGPRKRFVRRLKDLQDNLGVHQDAEVHVATLREIADEMHSRGETPQTVLAIGRLSERIDQRRLDARAEFAERFAKYDTKDTHRDLERALGRTS